MFNYFHLKILIYDLNTSTNYRPNLKKVKLYARLHGSYLTVFRKIATCSSTRTYLLSTNPYIHKQAHNFWKWPIILSSSWHILSLIPNIRVRVIFLSEPQFLWRALGRCWLRCLIWSYMTIACMTVIQNKPKHCRWCRRW